MEANLEQATLGAFTSGTFVDRYKRGVKFKQRDRKHVLRAALDAALSVPDGAPPESPPWLQPENAANLDARTEEFTASR